MILGTLSCDAQDHFDLHICRAAHVPATSAYRLEALDKLRAAGCMRVSVLVILRARSVCTKSWSMSFTDVRTRPVGIGIARSFTKSEYAQPPVLVSRSLFDTYSASRRQPQGAESSCPQCLTALTL